MVASQSSRSSGSRRNEHPDRNALTPPFCACTITLLRCIIVLAAASATGQKREC
jgi:hypothetical protein